MLEVRYVFEHGLRGERSTRLLRYLLAHGADEVSITVMALEDTLAPFADAFEDELGAYSRPVASRRVLTRAATTDSTRDVRLWTFNEGSVGRILSFLDMGLFHCPAGPDGWLEDLTIYRHGELVLGLISHELVGVLRLTHPEHADVAALDIPTEPIAEGICF